MKKYFHIVKTLINTYLYVTIVFVFIFRTYIYKFPNIAEIENSFNKYFDFVKNLSNENVTL